MGANETESLTLRRPYLQRSWGVVVWLVAGATAAHVVIAFLGVGLAVHRDLGLLVGLLVLVQATLAHLGQRPRDTRILSSALLLLVSLQPVWIGLGDRLPAFHAVHGFAAIAILGLALVLALDSDGSSDSSTASGTQEG